MPQLKSYIKDRLQKTLIKLNADGHGISTHISDDRLEHVYDYLFCKNAMEDAFGFYMMDFYGTSMPGLTDGDSYLASLRKITSDSISDINMNFKFLIIFDHADFRDYKLNILHAL